MLIEVRIELAALDGRRGRVWREGQRSFWNVANSRFPYLDANDTGVFNL